VSAGEVANVVVGLFLMVIWVVGGVLFGFGIGALYRLLKGELK
jgi:hypothetical protein